MGVIETAMRNQFLLVFVLVILFPLLRPEGEIGLADRLRDLDQ